MNQAETSHVMSGSFICHFNFCPQIAPDQHTHFLLKPDTTYFKYLHPASSKAALLITARCSKVGVEKNWFLKPKKNTDTKHNVIKEFGKILWLGKSAIYNASTWHVEKRDVAAKASHISQQAW